MDSTTESEDGSSADAERIPTSESVPALHRLDTPRTALIARIVVALTALMPLVWLAIRQVGSLGDHTIPCCDYAALDLGTRAFLRGEQLTGLYSRQGWRHPGPAPFLWNAPFRLLLGDSLAAERIGMVVLAIAAISIVLWVLGDRLRTLGFLAATAVIMAWLVRFDLRFLVEPWNPAMAMLWVLATVAATARFATGGSRRWLVATIVAGSMAVQCHLGAAPAVIVCLVVVGVTAWQRRVDRGIRIGVVVAVVVGLALWSMPLWDLALGDHNLWHIVTVDESGYTGGFAWSTMLTNLVQIVGLGPARQGFAFGAASPFLSGSSLDAPTVIVAVVSLVLAIRLLRDRSRHPRLAMIAGIAMIGLIATAALVSVSGGEYWPYVLLPVVGLGTLLATSGVTAAVLDLPFRRFVRLRPTVIAIESVAITALFVVLILQVPASFRVDDYSTPALRDITDQIHASCDRFPGPALVAFADDIAWTDAITIVAAIERCTTVRAFGNLGFVAGEPYGWHDGDWPNVYVQLGNGGQYRRTIIVRNQSFAVLTEPFGR